MEAREAFQLLTLASARDGRTVDAAVAQVWADDLEGISLQEALVAVREHYRESDKWLMPAHVIQRVREVRRGAPMRDAARLAIAESRDARSRAVPMPDHLREQMLGGRRV